MMRREAEMDDRKDDIVTTDEHATALRDVQRKVREISRGSSAMPVVKDIGRALEAGRRSEPYRQFVSARVNRVLCQHAHRLIAVANHRGKAIAIREANRVDLEYLRGVAQDLKELEEDTNRQVAELSNPSTRETLTTVSALAEVAIQQRASALLNLEVIENA